MFQNFLTFFRSPAQHVYSIFLGAKFHCNEPFKEMWNVNFCRGDPRKPATKEKNGSRL